MLVISIKQGLVVAVGHSIFILFPVNDWHNILAHQAVVSWCKFRKRVRVETTQMMMNHQIFLNGNQ